MKKQKAIMFGCGAEGKYSFAKIIHDYDVVAFSDNNSSLWGTKLFGIAVIPPVELQTYQDVTVIICVTSGFIDIAKQLETMGISCSIYLYGILYEYRDTILYPVTSGKTKAYKKRLKMIFQSFLFRMHLAAALIKLVIR